MTFYYNLLLGSDEDYSDEAASGENDGETTTLPPADAAS